MVNTIHGYDVGYTHRGSWKAYRRRHGHLLDEVPVAWDSDWRPGQPRPSLKVWFQDPDEAHERLKTGKSFVAALARKIAGSSSSSSKNIYGLFEVIPVELHLSECGRGLKPALFCTVVGRCGPAENTSNAPRP
jgi:hypothetical protein